MKRKKTATTPQKLLLDRGGGDSEEGTPVRGEDVECEVLTDRISCISLLKRDFTGRPAAEKLSEVYGRWREAQRASAWRMERQLKARRELDELIDSQLDRFDAHYNRAMLPARPRDVANVLVPPWKPPLENAAVSWLGDWRPSAILSLIPLLSSSSLLDLSPRAHRMLAEAIRRLRIQEAVLDEEMAEYQANCVFYLPFGRLCRGRNKRWRRTSAGDIGGAAAAGEVMRQMERVVGRAQHLRYRALEVALRSVLDRTQAAEFLVAFAGIQDLVHRLAARWRARSGPVSITVQAFNATHRFGPLARRLCYS